jgi:hypothetical protein
MAVPMRSTDFKSVVEPILNEVFDGIYTQRADEYKQVFVEKPGIARSYHEEPVLYGFPAAPEIPDGVPVTYNSGGVLFIQRYVYKVYGLAFALTKVLVEDGDHIRIGTTYAEHLAQALIETKETLCANIINRANNGSYIGGDGVSLVAPNHPIVGGVFSNQLNTPAAMSQTPVEQLLIQIRNAVDNNGKRIRLTPRKFVTGSANIMQGEVILKSVLRSGNANNDINPIMSLKLLSEGQANLSRVTSTTAWYIETDAPQGLKLLWRRKLDRNMEGHFETDSMRYKATERYIPNWTDPRILWGTVGL